MVSDENIRRMTVIYSGRVQGVGFRFTACRLASGFHVNGFVRNRMNGDVELTAEGGVQALKELLDEIRGSHLSRGIVREQVSWSGATGEFKTFGITY